MTYEHHQNKQQRRQAERRQQQIRRRRNLARIAGITAIAAVILLVAGVLIFRSLSEEPQPQLSSTPTAPPSTTPSAVPTEPPAPTEPQTQIQLVFGGDLVADNGAVATGQPDYTGLFMDIAPVLSKADAAIFNFEGSTYGTSAAPRELLKAMSNAGADFVQMANSCTVSNGILGLGATLESIRAEGMTPVGAYSDEQQAKQEQGFTLCDIGGIRVAMVGYTKGFDGLSLPQNSQWSVNLLYSDYATTYQQVAEEAIKATMQNIQHQNPDLTVALLHWGSTYNDIISASQKKIEKLLLENGVDVIIGTHSHYVQQVKYDAVAGTVVAYSLGDLFSGGEKNGSHYSILLQLEVTRDNLTGQTKVTACDYVPIYTLTPQRDGETMRVVRIDAAMEQYESSYVHRVSAEAYQNIKNALSRIRSRVGF